MTANVSCPHGIRLELICPTTQISPHSASPDDEGQKNPLRVNFNLHSDFKVIWVVQSLSQKHFAGFVGQISSPVRAISSPGGADRDRHERGMGCGGRDSVGAQSVRRAVSVSEQFTQDERRCFRLRQDFVGRVPGPAKPLGKDGVAYGKTVWS